MDTKIRKLLFVCGFTSIVSGLIMVIVCLFFDDESFDMFRIFVSLMALFNGALFLLLSRKKTT